MIQIKKFNENKIENEKEQEVLFNSEVLVDKDEKPSFKTEVEDQENDRKEFDKMTTIKKFENFTIEVEVEVKNNSQEQEQQVGCGCCDRCTGEEGCNCCQDCECGVGLQEVEQINDESNPENDVNVMNISDFINSISNK